jgi:hypothetical protein
VAQFNDDFEDDVLPVAAHCGATRVVHETPPESSSDPSCRALGESVGHRWPSGVCMGRALFPLVLCIDGHQGTKGQGLGKRFVGQGFVAKRIFGDINEAPGASIPSRASHELRLRSGDFGSPMLVAPSRGRGTRESMKEGLLALGFASGVCLRGSDVDAFIRVAVDVTINCSSPHVF